MCSFRSFYLFTCFSFRFQLQFSLFFSVYIYFCCWPTYQFELNDVAQSSYCFATTNSANQRLTLPFSYYFFDYFVVVFHSKIRLKRFQRFILSSDRRTVWMTVDFPRWSAGFGLDLMIGFLLVIKLLTN